MISSPGLHLQVQGVGLGMKELEKEFGKVSDSVKS